MNLLASNGRTTWCGLGRLAAVIGAIFSPLVLAPQVAFGATSVVAGTSLTLVASADGSPAPTFQWRKNGTAIPGATAQTLSFVGIAAADAATYQVVATNSAGAATSPDEVITVVTSDTPIPPAISSQPTAAQTVAAGASVTLTVGASGYPMPSFQWQKGGVAISGATTATLTLGSVTTSDSGTYTVVVANTAGSVGSNASSLTVTEASVLIAPSILTQPASSQSLVAGSPTSFSVAVSGSPTPAMQWKKDGTAISGATNSTLSLSSVTVSDAGSYVAVATNSAGSVSSSAAILTVTAPVVGGTAPKIATQPASQTVAMGTAVSFTVAATGSPAPTYQWRKNGSNITGATATTLALNSVSTADAAAYSVVVTNTGGAVVSDGAMLYVQSAPVITGQPAAQAVLSGSSAMFTATVSAIPGAALQWKKDGNSISGATSAVLLISSVSTTDVGKYKLVATNSLGSTTSDEVTLVIATAPIITSQPAGQSVSAKSNVTFTVGATANPAPTFQWKKNGVAIVGETKATLTLKGVNKSDAGDYVVEVRNVVGWVPSNRATLSVANQTGRNSAEEDDPAIANSPDGVTSGLVNLSVRANAGTGSNGLIVGFVVDGASSKSVLVRGVGPTLRDFGVNGVLLDPQLALYSGATVTASNDDWSSNENAAQIAGVSARVGAFGLADRASDSALMATLAQGAYTVQLSGKESSTGVALVEVYDAATNSTTKLVNLSVRTFIGSATDAPNVGFVIAGSSPRRLLIRAVGPTLGGFGVTDAIADPQLELYRGTTRVDLNDNWGGGAALGNTFAQVGAFGLSDASSKDSVLLTTLDPGAYTVVVSGVNGAKGVGLVEVYDAP